VEYAESTRGLLACEKESFGTDWDISGGKRGPNGGGMTGRDLTPSTTFAGRKEMSCRLGEETPELAITEFRVHFERHFPSSS
jgi:hypothetical protein